jgi:hypothetical protein
MLEAGYDRTGPIRHQDRATRDAREHAARIRQDRNRSGRGACCWTRPALGNLSAEGVRTLLERSGHLPPPLIRAGLRPGLDGRWAIPTKVSKWPQASTQPVATMLDQAACPRLGHITASRRPNHGHAMVLAVIERWMASRGNPAESPSPRLLLLAVRPVARH